MAGWRLAVLSIFPDDVIEIIFDGVSIEVVFAAVIDVFGESLIVFQKIVCELMVDAVHDVVGEHVGG